MSALNRGERLPRLDAFGRGLLDGAALASLAVIALLPLVDLVMARLFWSGVPSAGPLLEHALLALTFLSAAVATREERHLSLGPGSEGAEGHDSGLLAAAEAASRRPLLRRLLESLRKGLARGVEAGSTAIFFWASLSLLMTGFDAGQRTWFIPTRLLVAAMPAGFLAMAILALQRKGLASRLGALAGLAAGSFLAAPAIANLVASTPALAGSAGLAAGLQVLGAAASAVLHAAVLPLCLVVVLGAVAGAPIFSVLGGLAMLLLGAGGSYLELGPSEAYALLRGATLPALPLFALAGYLLAESGAGKRLVAVFRELFGWLPGGEAVAAVLACAFLTTFTGANGVTILALGGLLASILSEAGPYKPGFARGLVTASGAVGLLLPPSAAVIVYGVNAQFIYGQGANLDVTSLFKAALIPGLILVLAMCGAGVWAAKRSGVPKRKFDRKAAGAALKPAFLELLTPAIAGGLYFTGLAGLTEIGAITVLYLAVVEGLVKRELGPKRLVAAARKSLAVIGGTLVILAAARALSFYLIDAGAPEAFTAWASAKAVSPLVFLIFLNLSLLVVGCLMDIYSAILIAAPLVIPLGALYGLHPAHLGVIFIMNLCIGFLTPPVGMNLFLASYAFRMPLKKIFKETMPFFVIQLLVLVLVTYLPFLSTMLLGPTP